MHTHIVDQLRKLESEEGVRVLLAVESGSRAWGFASPDSDWDVRFVYVRPLDRYLSITRDRDVIEKSLPLELDLAGWDLPKALGLFAKSNPTMLEWLRSPIVYVSNDPFVKELRSLEPEYLQCEAGIYHYRSMALGNHKNFLLGDAVRLKKYLYVLRPILACQFLERFRVWPPTEFAGLLDAQLPNGPVRQAVDDLLKVKAVTRELGEGSPNPILTAFIEAELVRLEALEIRSNPPARVESLDQLFRKWAHNGA